MFTKKDVERQKLNRFAEISGCVSVTEVYNFEEPDFLLYLSKGILGIELTDLFWEEKIGIIPQQASESLRARIVASAGHIYAEQGQPTLCAFVHFNPSYVPHKNDVDRLSRAIAQLVAANIPEEGAHYLERYRWQNKDYFPQEVERIGISRFAGLDRTFFTPVEAAFTPDLEARDIERTLELKESKLLEYRKWCDEVWLLINCDMDWMATTFGHNKNVFEREFRTGFDRVFLLRHMADKIHELKLLRKSLIAPPASS